jgi:hypothetical protein
VLRGLARAVVERARMRGAAQVVKLQVQVGPADVPLALSWKVLALGPNCALRLNPRTTRARACRAMCWFGPGQRRVCCSPDRRGKALPPEVLTRLRDLSLAFASDVLSPLRDCNVPCV